MTNNIRTLTDIQHVNNVENNEFLRIIRARLESNDYRLPFLGSSPDAWIIRNLNEVLNEDEIRQIMECVVNQQFNKDIILIMLKAIPVDFLLKFLDLRGLTDISGFHNFLNFLVYMSVGVGDFLTAQALINDILIEMLSVVTDDEINPVDLSTTSENLQTQNENENNARNINFSNRMVTIWGSISWSTILRRTISIGGAIGLATFWGPQLYTGIFSTIGASLGTSIANNLSTENTLVGQNVNNINADKVMASIKNSFSLLKLYFFGKW